MSDSTPCARRNLPQFAQILRRGLSSRDIDFVFNHGWLRCDFDLIAEITHDAYERRHDNLEPRSQTLRARQFACTLNLCVFKRINAAVEVSRPAVICVKTLINRREAVADTLVEANEEIASFKREGVVHRATASTIAVSIAAVEADRPALISHVSATDLTAGTSQTIFA